MMVSLVNWVDTHCSVGGFIVLYISLAHAVYPFPTLRVPFILSTRAAGRLVFKFFLLAFPDLASFLFYIPYLPSVQ